MRSLFAVVNLEPAHWHLLTVPGYHETHYPGIIPAYAGNTDFDFEDFGFDSGFDAIQDLLDDDLVSLKDELEKTSFNITLTFPIDKKQSVKDFLDDAGKDQAVSIIVKAAEQWG